MSLISVIVPIYKVEEYLDRCVQSILNQTWKEFELILVDDGSPDRCPQICDLWAKKDGRIKVIHKANGGLSDARNAGMQTASGEFVAFVDSDDWVAPDYLRILLEVMQKKDCDIVECNVIRTNGEDLGEVLPVEEGNSITLFQTEQALEHLIKDECFHQHVWNKLYRRSVIHGILFEKGKTNEDEFWTYQIFGNAKVVGKVEVPLYYYLQRSSGIMGEGYSLKRLDALEAKVQRQKYIEKKYPKLNAIAKCNLFTSCIYQGQMVLLHLEGKTYIEAKTRISQIVKAMKISGRNYADIPLGQKIWIVSAKYAFWGTCRVKNLLKKGF